MYDSTKKLAKMDKQIIINEQIYENVDFFVFVTQVKTEI